MSDIDMGNKPVEITRRNHKYELVALFSEQSV